MAAENDSATTAEIADVLGPPPAEFDTNATPSGVLETVLLRFLARIIHADGDVHPKEMSALIDIAIQLELASGEARRILDDEFARQSDPEVLAAQLPEERRKQAYAMGCVMCCADGDVADEERAVLAAFAKGAGIGDDDAARILDKLTAAMVKAQADAAAG